MVRDEANSVPTRSTPEDALFGKRVGNYEILSVLGEGGFGTVYKARDMKLGRDVALKFLRDPLEPKHREMLEREAKALAALSKHDAIVQIYEWGEYEGHTYFALEFVESNAKALLRESPKGLPLAKALHIVAETAEAVAYAHKQRILHGDIKPANILVEPESGRVKIADFGLARVYESTQIGTSEHMGGTPPYMAPEQANRQRTDFRTDIFALGVTLYELLCGEIPFEGATLSEVLERIRKNDRIPLRERREDLPDIIYDIVSKATAHRPARRFQSADELAEQLRKVLNMLKGKQDLATLRIHDRFSLRAIPSQKRWIPIAAAILILLGVTATLRGRRGKELPWAVALAQAEEMMNRGDFEEAQEHYQTVLLEHSKSNEAIYGLGYALLRQGKDSEAAAEFGKIGDLSLGTEGQAAVAYEREGEDARQVLESGLSVVPTGYLETLLAASDVVAGDYQDAVDKLKSLDSKNFNFDWQREQYLQTLGQAYYHLGDYENAKRIFKQLGKSGSPAMVALAGAYAELARGRADAERRAAIREQIKSIRALMEEEGYQEPDEVDLWTSRPIGFFILPADPGRSPAVRFDG